MSINLITTQKSAATIQRTIQHILDDNMWEDEDLEILKSIFPELREQIASTDPKTADQNHVIDEVSSKHIQTPSNGYSTGFRTDSTDNASHESEEKILPMPTSKSTPKRQKLMFKSSPIKINGQTFGDKPLQAKENAIPAPNSANMIN